MRLAVHIQTLARLRDQEGGDIPDPVTGAAALDLAGADGIVFHYGSNPDRDDRDLELLRSMVKSHLNVEIEPKESLLRRVIDIRPDQVTLIPEDGGDGLDVVKRAGDFQGLVDSLKAAGIDVSLQVLPDIAQVKEVRRIQADYVTLFTGGFTRATDVREALVALEDVESAALGAMRLELRVLVKGGINHRNIGPLASLEMVEEAILGHELFARAVFIGTERALGEIRDVVQRQVLAE